MSGLNEFFKENKIEYFAIIPFDECRITKPHLVDRIAFTPKSVIVFLIPYFIEEGTNVSSYAVSRDYHIFIRKIGDELCRLLDEKYSCHSRAFGDHSPIDERDAAAKCGLGILGKNGLLINEKYGSYVFIGEVITSAELECIYTTSNVQTCCECGLCTTACPKGEIGECLSALTQKKGDLTEKEAFFILKYNTAWGCDICQSVCPYNQNPKQTPIDFFYTSKIKSLNTSLLENMTDTEFSERAYSWRGKETVLRNLKLLEKM